MKEATAKDLRNLLRKYNVVLVGEEGIEEAWGKFFKEAGIKRLPPKKGQKETRDHLYRCGVFDTPPVLVIKVRVKK